jgi:alkylation response protein AidB-like acyl-CoA dehydrogenase
MDLGFSKSEKLFIESARGFLAKEAQQVFREAELSPEGYSKNLWRQMADLGWMGILFPEKYGGVDGNFLELIFLLEEMGKALVPGPFIATMISGFSLLQHGTQMQKEDILPKLTSGKLVVLPCFITPDPALRAANAQEHVDLKEDGYRLRGTRLFVSYALSADWLFYDAQISEGQTVFVVGATTAGINCNPLETLASDRQCEVVLDGASVSPSNVVGEKGKGAEIKREIEQWGALCESAYILGLLEKVLEMAVNHAKIRVQFGRPIGSFQAIQHQCADMITEIDKLKFLTYQAAWKLSVGMPADKEIHMAKAKASDASRKVTLLGIKIHGGVGITQEYDLQFYFRRAKASEIAFGDGDAHRESVAQSLDL